MLLVGINKQPYLTPGIVFVVLIVATFMRVINHRHILATAWCNKQGL